jgi:hypothetical protein
MKKLFEMQAAIVGNHLVGQINKQDERLMKISFEASNGFVIRSIKTSDFLKQPRILEINGDWGGYDKHLMWTTFNSPESLQSYLSAMKIGFEELAVEHGKQGEWVDDWKNPGDRDIVIQMKEGETIYTGKYCAGIHCFVTEDNKRVYKKQPVKFRTIPQLTITPDSDGNGQIYRVWG